MHDRVHDDELPIDDGAVRSLLEAQLPDVSGCELTRLPPSGTDNALWRIHRSDERDLVMRLPRTPSSAAGLTSEIDILIQLRSRPLPCPVPVVHHRGEPTETFANPWAVLEWIDGVDGWQARESIAANDEAVAVALAEIVAAVGSLDRLRAPVRPPGRRGGPLPALLDGLDRILADPAWSAANHLDIAAVRRLADQARELAGAAIEPRFVHGDLLPGNLLVDRGRLAAVIDWGSAAIADPAQDLAPAWSALGPVGRRRFRHTLEVDEATWLRGRTFELEHAVVAILYYRPKGHVLADVMARTLDRILADADRGSK